MVRYLKFAVSVDLERDEVIGKLVIQRTLQVVGEFLNNTPTSPNVSSKMNQLLKVAAPKHFEGIVHKLRNPLTHANTLPKKIELERTQDRKFYYDVKIDLIKVSSRVNYIFNDLKFSSVQIVLQRFENFDDLDCVRSLAKELSELRFEAHDLMTYVNICNNLERFTNDYPTAEILTWDERLRGLPYAENVVKHIVNDLDEYEDGHISEIVFASLLQYLKQPSALKMLLCRIPPEKKHFPHYRNREAKLHEQNPGEYHSLDFTDCFLARKLALGNISNLDDFKEELNRVTKSVEVVQENVIRPIENALKPEELKVFQEKLGVKQQTHASKSKLLEVISGEESDWDFYELFDLLKPKDAPNVKRNYEEGNYKECSKLTLRIDDSFGNLVNKLAETSLLSVKKYKPTVLKFLETLKLTKRLQQRITKLANAIIDEQIQSYLTSRLEILETIVVGQNPAQLSEDGVKMAAIEAILLDVLEILENLDRFIEGQ